MPSAVARVAVNRPLREPLDYALPPELADAARLGMRVLVPLQRERTVGVIVELADESPHAKLRNVLELLDEQPVVDATMLCLTRWIAEYYVCSWGESLACAVPPGGRWKPVVRYCLAASGADEVAALLARIARAPRQAAVVEYLYAHGAASPRMIRQVTGGAPVQTVLRRLMEAGDVQAVVGEPPLTAAPRTVLAVEPMCAPDELRTQAAAVAASAPRQAAVLHALSERTGSWPAADLLATTAAGHGTLRALERKALVRMVSLERQRVPAAPSALFAAGGRPSLTAEQAQVVAVVTAQLDRDAFAACLLNGVTGSGKTEVYLRAAEHTLAHDRDVIVLVPEISLTAQTVARFRARFGDQVAVLHSRLSAGERADQWRALQARTRRIAIGPRSAVFAPVPRLGLIVVDEEHEGAYKQQDAPRYHARDVAVMRASMAGAVALLGSATPSLESTVNVATEKYLNLTLTRRARGEPLPPVEIVDLREATRGQRDRTCSDALLNRLGETLDRKEQAIVFLNRRGFAPTLLCPQCGVSQQCEQCSVSMIWHRGPDVVRCHYCNAERPTPKVCAYCGGESLLPLGAGTQKVEQEIAGWFPQARVVRMDADTTTRKGAHAKILTRMAAREIDVLVGTQMIAKGLDFPNVTLVGVINVDTGLTFPDFRAAERTGQMLMQVAGRSGRGPKGGTVLFQTYRPEHYAVRAAATHDYRMLAEQELAYRRELRYPPWRHLGRVLCDGPAQGEVAREMARVAHALGGPGVDVLGPAPAPLTRVQGRYRWHCQILAERPAALRRALEAARRAAAAGTGRVRTTVDMDAHNLL